MPEHKFTLPEFTGSLADLGTIIPFVLVAVSIADMKLGPILLMFGLFYIFTGVIFKLPVAVEPLKVVGAIIISVGLTQGEIIGAGLFVGLFFILIAITGIINYIEKIFPLSLIRGVQLGLAFVLIFKGGQYIYQDMLIGILAVLIFVASKYFNDRTEDLNFPGALIIFILGILYGIYAHGQPPVNLNIPLDLYVPTIGEVVSGAYKAGIPQIPLTLTNAVLATSLLASDLFKEKISNKKLSLSIGVVNVTLPFMGGFPMCHGAGGMAAHYKFGARTGGANIMIGTVFILLSFISTSEMLAVIPIGILGTLLFFAGAELLKNALKTDILIITVMMGVIVMIVDATAGLAAGIVAYVLYYLFFKPKKAGKTDEEEKI
ncbi:sulfate transporter [Methanocella sp. CWC-04]|uniref:Sulfate transporter n=1 Tax=Methanooceanicella nereidis TaxID=2052831 RepID=A0AAP2RDZ0_9EURY|nr:putative sulfate/molybdate transporter [Methanocella sp. CWC-04]MCD1294280.1 sulfate transporter [Methanocella sp. CWC-04]